MNANFAAAYNRNPAWKWNRAQDIVHRNGIPATAAWDTENGMQWINRLVGFIRSYERDNNPLSNHELFTLYGDIYQAHSMYTDASSYYKYELEGMILARREPEILADDIGTSVSAILAYEEAFFDVRSKLSVSESYIQNFVIGKEFQDIRNDDYNTLWKHYGYYYGPEMLKAVIHKTVNPQMCMTADVVGSQLKEDIIGSSNIAASIASKRRGGGSRADRELVQMATKIFEVNKMEDLSGGSARGQMTDHIIAMLATLGLTVGGTTVPTVTGDPTKSGEPQFKEFVELMLHGKSDSYEAEQNFTFPKPEKR